MLFETLGDEKNPAVLFFHAMGVTAKSSERVAKYLEKDYFCIMPTSTAYCRGQRYLGKEDEIRQIEEFLKIHGVEKLELVAASSLGADLALAFLSRSKVAVNRVFFDGGQFAAIKKPLRMLAVPFMYLVLKALYLSDGKLLGKVLWCDDENIRPYFVEGGKNVTFGNLRRMLSDSLEDKPLPKLSEKLQRRIFFEFGSAEEHFKYRNAVMSAYPCGNFPVFEGFNHMQFQIADPKGFAHMLRYVSDTGRMPQLAFLREEGTKSEIRH